MKKQYEDERLQSWVILLNKKIRRRGWTMDQVRMLGRDSEDDLLDVLEAYDEDVYYPFDNLDDWYDFVDYYQEQREQTIEARIIRDSERGTGDRTVSELPNKPWHAFREGLIDRKEIPISSIEQMKASSEDVLNLLADGSNDDHGPVRGLVMGNVQSGKTANMESLMAMTAEFGWNVYIILTGTIESLRIQTEERMHRDLPSKGVGWQFIPRISFNGAFAPSSLKLRKGDSDRYVITCLKNSSRLKTLLRWLNYDQSKKQMMRVLIIDDESDQASLNTKKMNLQDGMTEDEAEEAEQERTRINKEIMAIVNGNMSVDSSEQTSYLAMNYVCYTATPYGNFLNESGDESLYPKDFIKVLPMADTYFGPQQIFGDPVNGTSDGLRIINEIPDQSTGVPEEQDDVKRIEEIYDAWKAGDAALPTPPQSMQDAIAWFCNCVAIRRREAEARHDKKIRPVSMMVHHSMKTDYHAGIAKAIRQWFDAIPESTFLQLCERVYQEQTEKFTRETFCSSWPGYGRACGYDLLETPEDIIDYPSFEEIRGQLIDFKKRKTTHILFDQKLSYSRGLILCVDNSRNQQVVEDTTGDISQVRLIYPHSGDECPTPVPAFLVVGGNTLARGLTLQGLVCSYFSRTVHQADTLMQMGRWFGYRRGYELLPRIWMTRNAADMFEKLTEIDIRLREDIRDRYLSYTPEQCGPAIRNLPGIALTARNKMQGADTAEMSFAGAHLQTQEFEDIPSVLERNIDEMDAFLRNLGAPENFLTTSHSRVWTGVPFADISGLLSRSSYKLTRQTSTAVFCEWFRQMASQFDDWDVILYGTNAVNLPKSDVWNGVGKVKRSRKLSGVRTEHSQNLSIGVLSDPNAWRADIPLYLFENLSIEDKALLDKAKITRSEKERIAEIKKKLLDDAGKKNTPRMVVYRVDKNSKVRTQVNGGRGTSRCDLNTSADLIGLELMIPGQLENKNYVAAVSIRISEKEG